MNTSPKFIFVSVLAGLIVGLGIGFWQGNRIAQSPAASGPGGTVKIVAVPPPSNPAMDPVNTLKASGSTSTVPAPQAATTTANPLLPGQHVTAPAGNYSPPK